MQAKLPWGLRQVSIWVFAKIYRIEIDLAEKSLSDYHSIGEFFARKIKLEKRPLGQSFFLHPADSVLLAQGELGEHQAEFLFQVKENKNPLSVFLGPLLLSKEPNLFDQLKGGSYRVYYLCPTDYHRVHSPAQGRVKWVVYCPGDLYPVNACGLKKVPELYCVNERVHLCIETQLGLIIVTLVGATNVGSIGITCLSEVQQFLKSGESKAWRIDHPINKGDELGWFGMGSSVVVLSGPRLNSSLFKGTLPRTVLVRSDI
jgi:phosphatidylserine decarboxylase